MQFETRISGIMEKIGRFVDYTTVGGKDVFLVDEHHHALLPWAILCRRSREPLNLISLDHHTDTHEPFSGYRYRVNSPDGISVDWDRMKGLLAPMIASVDLSDDVSVTQAIMKLKNDEHVSTATLTKILDWAFCINLSHSTTESREEHVWRQHALENSIRGIPFPSPPYTYDVPDNRIFTISAYCAVDCCGPHTEACAPRHSAQVIESIYLDQQLSIASTMYACVTGGHVLSSAPYILDIDLDYFHSASAIHPKNAQAFYQLIRGAAGITIAREPYYVEEERLEGETITSASLQLALMAHIEAAVTI